MGSLMNNNIVWCVKLQRISQVLALLVFLFLVLPTSAFAASVTLEVNWPEFASENGVSIETTGGTTVSGGGPFTSGGVNDNYTNTFGPVTLTDGNSYLLQITDSYGDGWNGAGAQVSVKIDGVQIGTATTLGIGDTFEFTASTSSSLTLYVPPPTLCNTTTPIPSGAVTLSFADVAWPDNIYTTQTYNNIDNDTVDIAISVSDSSTITSVAESNTNTGNGDTAPFFMTSGLGSGSTTFTFDISSNPSSFIDLCVYHINLRGGGDKVQLQAVTDTGAILTNPTFTPPS